LELFGFFSQDEADHVVDGLGLVLQPGRIAEIDTRCQSDDWLRLYLLTVGALLVDIPNELHVLSP